MSVDLSSFLAGRLAEEQITQADLARELGVSQPTISALLNGAEPRRPLYDKLIRRYPQLIGSIFASAS